jgi:hypothetical protein
VSAVALLGAAVGLLGALCSPPPSRPFAVPLVPARALEEVAA